MSLELDYSEFESALLLVERVTGRSMPDSLNRAAKHVLIGSGSRPGAMQLTPKASKAKIQAVPIRKIMGYVIKKAKARGEWPLSNAEVRSRANKERKRRASASGYAAYIGWNNAAKAVGGRGVKTNDEFARSNAAKGSGKKASPMDLESVLVNAVPAAVGIGLGPLQQGLDNAAADLVDYATKKMQSTFNTVNP